MKVIKDKIFFIPEPKGKELEVYNKIVNNELKKIPDNFIEKIPDNLLIKIFVSPDCTYCPQVVWEYSSLALLTNKIKRVEVIDVLDDNNYSEVEKYEVSSVPAVFVNDEKIEHIKLLGR